MKTTGIFLIFFGFGFGHNAFAQFPGCPAVDAGADQNINCSTPCTDLTATPFNAGATTSYTATSIPHNPPIQYNEPGGTGVSVGTDDIWSGVINLPFNFCYYGQTYTQCTIGSNGAIKFGTSLANAFHPWSFTASVPSTALTNAGDIMGPYHDIDPSVAGTVRWYLVGTAPCRIFVVSFNAIAHFSCTNLQSTHMIVLYETTNAIDVYVQNKATCGSWNSGNTVIGIQNPTGTQGLAAPGRNTGPWTVTVPEGWRFLPSGAPIYTVEWLEGGNVIGTGNTVNVCPVVPTTYTAQATYTSCDGTIIIETDDVVVTPAPTGITVSEISNTPASCGAPNGGFEVSASGGVGPYTYSLDNVTYQPSGVFSGLVAGTYTVFAQDANGCISPYGIDILNNSTLDMTFTSVQDISCNGAADGQISVSAIGGTTPYSFTLNGGAPAASSTFSNLSAGAYSIEVTDDVGCVFSIDTLITEPNAIVITEIGTLNTSCGLSNGELEVDATGGSFPYTYSINGGTTSQPGGLFTGLAGATYTVLVTDNNGCTNQLNVIVNDDPYPTLSVATVNSVSCNGESDGSVVLNTASGVAPFVYTINGGSAQGNGTFSGLGQGTYAFQVTDANGCVSSVNGTVAEPEPLIVNLGNDYTVCEGTAVSINANVSGGTPAYGYSWNVGGSGPIVSETPSTTTSYTVTVTDGNGCTANATQTITVVPYPVADGYNDIYTGYAPLSVVFNNLSSSATNYEWNFGDGSVVNVNTVQDVSHTYDAPGTYTVILTASNGSCETTWFTEIIVISYPDVVFEVPNVFTPNNDNENDLYFIELENAASLEGVIVNRWGNVMVEFNDLNFVWDGKVNGSEVDEGVYFIKYKIVGLNEAIIEGHTFFHLFR